MKKGVCGICLTAGPLTKDHVPPKGTVTPSTVVIRDFAEHFAIPKLPGHPGRHSATFRTICHVCNGDRLGTQYDPALKAACRRVDSWLRANRLGLSLPETMRVDVCPQRVARSIVGHLLASGVTPDTLRHEGGPVMVQAMRTYFLAPDAPLPSEISIFTWPYPSPIRTVIPAFLRSALGKL